MLEERKPAKTKRRHRPDGRNRIPFEGDPEVQAGLALLRDRGFSGLLLLGAGSQEYHPDVYSALTEILGTPITSDGHAAVWSLPEVSYSEDTMETLREAHSVRVKALRGILPGVLNRPLR